jgi:hypothetical protein
MGGAIFLLIGASAKGFGVRSTSPRLQSGPFLVAPTPPGGLRKMLNSGHVGPKTQP